MAKTTRKRKSLQNNSGLSKVGSEILSQKIWKIHENHIQKPYIPAKTVWNMHVFRIRAAEQSGNENDQTQNNDLASADAAPGLVSFWISNLQFSLVHTTSNQCFAIAMKFSTFVQYHIRSNLNKYKQIWRNFLCTSNSNLVYPIIDGVAKLLIDLWFSIKIPLLGSRGTFRRGYGHFGSRVWALTAHSPRLI